MNETNELTVKPLLVPVQLTDLDHARVVIGPVSYPVKRETNHESHPKARTTRESRTFVRRVSPGPLLLDELCFPIHGRPPSVPQPPFY